eukprot:517006-Prymnesium_polylepis.1
MTPHPLDGGARLALGGGETGVLPVKAIRAAGALSRTSQRILPNRTPKAIRLTLFRLILPSVTFFAFPARGRCLVRP